MEKTLLKGLSLLEAIARSPEPRGVSDVAAELGMTRSNAHRLLQTLTMAKFAVHDPVQGQYAASLKLFELGMLLGSRIDVRTVARPIMEAIVGRTGENASLAVLDEHDVVYIERVDSPNPVRAVVRTGERLPSYSSSSGKVLLAWSDTVVVDSLKGHLEPFTKHTITDLDELKRVLARVRRSGICVTRNEWHLELSSVAVPVHDRQGKVIAALAVSGPTSRFKPKNVETYISAVQWGAKEISARLS